MSVFYTLPLNLPLPAIVRDKILSQADFWSDPVKLFLHSKNVRQPKTSTLADTLCSRKLTIEAMARCSRWMKLTEEKLGEGEDKETTKSLHLKQISPLHI